MMGDRILVVDDDALVREAIAEHVSAPGHDVAVYASGEALLAEAELAEPAAVILDLRMPGMSGIDVLTELRERRSPLRVVLLSGHADIPSAVAAVKLGAIDFVEKPYAVGKLREVVERALAASRRAAEKAALVKGGRMAVLTPRERTVIEALAHGGSNRSVADELGLSPRTVEMHRASAMKRLGARGFADAVRIVLEELKSS